MPSYLSLLRSYVNSSFHGFRLFFCLLLVLAKFHDLEPAESSEEPAITGVRKQGKNRNNKNRLNAQTMKP